MPFATISREPHRNSLLNGARYILEDPFLPRGNIYLLAAAELPGRAEASPVRVSEANCFYTRGLELLDYAVFFFIVVVGFSFSFFF